MSWLIEKTAPLLAQVEQARALDAFPYFRPMENVGVRVKIGERWYLNFTSNDYLGLSQDARLKARATAGIERFGNGLGSSRLQATTPLHEELESRLANWLGLEASALFASGYQTLVGVLAAFLDDDSAVIADTYSHASILDGILLAKGKHPDLEERFFRHNSLKALRRCLQTTEKPNQLVVVEGLYSADGDLAPLADIAALCREFEAPLLVDDAHGLGAIGPGGRGAAEVHGVLEQVDLLVGTFSKAFGGVGGFVGGAQPLVDYLKLAANSFAFSASLPAAQVEGALAALDVLQGDSILLQRLESNKTFFRQGLLNLGLDLGTSESHITPIMIGDEEKALTLGAQLFDEGILMLPFVYPGVPKGQARLRCAVTAAHSREDLQHTLEILKSIVAGTGTDLQESLPASNSAAQ
jgi:glycine C-acetyltransferase